ncbi:hypothetical protein Agabi119p4_2787 [Agaricus bisporus var. burnettii]|uniref:Uncharacterized protein n=1 Tax=Agaricus bisporus var. burnettii TaxID=192524 RepID=A0A8H7F5V0_AGABI|nr:hypothetical protein Agabi119p4_2787 [Agaricus bisporus var. burnettii]
MHHSDSKTNNESEQNFFLVGWGKGDPLELRDRAGKCQKAADKFISNFRVAVLTISKLFIRTCPPSQLA